MGSSTEPCRTQHVTGDEVGKGDGVETEERQEDGNEMNHWREREDMPKERQ